jgi:hypothetical protein
LEPLIYVPSGAGTADHVKEIARLLIDRGHQLLQEVERCKSPDTPAIKAKKTQAPFCHDDKFQKASLEVELFAELCFHEIFDI